MNQLNRDILRIALPSIVTNVTVPLLGLCDVAVMGHVGGAVSIGAIAVGSMIFNVMYWLLGCLRMGTSGLTAQAFGANSHDEVWRLLRRGLIVGVALGVLLVAIQVPLRHLSLWMMQTPSDVASQVIPYFNICIWGAPAVLGLYVFTGWFIGMQDTRTPMAIAILQNVLNIASSLLFVFVFHMGVEGVALGTVVAQWAGFALAAKKVRGKQVAFASHPSPLNSPLSRTRPKVACNQRDARRMLAKQELSPLSVYLDIFLRTVCLVAVNLYFTSAGAAQGPLILAANTLLMQLFTFFSYIMDGFANAGEALSGRFTGAQDNTMLSRTVRQLFGWGIAMMLLFFLLYVVGGQAFLHLLTTDTTVVNTASGYLSWAVIIPVAGMAAFVWDGIFIGTTRSRGMFLSCFIASIAFFILFFLLSPAMGNHALWLAFLSFLAVRGVVQTLLYFLPSRSAGVR